MNQIREFEIKFVLINFDFDKVLSQTIMTPDLKVVPFFSDDGSFDAEWSI